MAHQLRIKSRVLWPLSLLLTLAAAAAVAGYYWKERSEVVTGFAQRIHAAQSVLHSLFKLRGETLAIALESTLQDPALRGAFLKRNRGALLATVQPHFQDLASSQGITQFYFHEPDRRSFLRVHDPAHYGDMIDREILSNARRTGDPVYGLELDESGALMLRVVLPWRERNEFIGFVEVGEPVESFAYELRKQFGFEYVISLDKKFLERTRWESAMSAAKRPHSWDLYPDVVLVDRTAANLPSAVPLQMSSDTRPAGLEGFSVSQGGQHLRVGILPLRDTQNRQVGTLALLQDVTIPTASLYEMVQYVALVAMVAVLLLITLFYEILGRLQYRVEFALASAQPQTAPPPTEPAAAQPPQIAGLSRNLAPAAGQDAQQSLENMLQQRLADAGAKGSPLTVLYLELANLPQFSATFGQLNAHAVQLEAIRRIRDALGGNALLGPAGHFRLAAAYSGDGAAVDESFRRLTAAFAQPLTVGGADIRLHVRAGAAVHPDHGANGPGLLRCAELALEHATPDTPLVRYDAGKHKRGSFRLKRLEELQHAIERREMKVYYAPLVGLSTARVVGAEAMLRWRHPHDNWIEPEGFLPLAESAGYLPELTDWLIDSTLAQYDNWARAGIDLEITLNLVTQDLLDPSLPDRIDAALARHTLPRESLTLDVPEGALALHGNAARRAIQQLARLGAHVFLDDVGASRTWMPDLRYLPVTGIKLHRSLTSGIADQHDSAVMVRSLITTAHQMGLQVTAQGVQKKAVWDLLANFGCEFAEGHHISKPVSSGVFECWLVNSKYGLGRVGAVCTGINEN